MTNPMRPLPPRTLPGDRRSTVWLLLLIAVTTVTTLDTVTDAQWPGRPLFALGFFLLVPGGAMVSWIGLDDRLAEITVGAAASIGLSTLLALVMLWLGLWNPAAAQVILAGLSAPLLVWRLLRSPTVDAKTGPRSEPETMAGSDGGGSGA